MRNRKYGTLAPVLLLAGVAACTPEQNQAWKSWFEVDPEAAVEFAHEGCGGLGCSVDDGSSVASGNWTDVTTDDPIFDEPEDEPEAWGQCSEWMDDALAAGWTEDQWGTLNWIMAAESGCNPNAQNPSGASGLLQIMPMWIDDCGGGSLFDPWFNLACGLVVYHEQGWTAWSVYN